LRSQEQAIMCYSFTFYYSMNSVIPDLYVPLTVIFISYFIVLEQYLEIWS